jgi:hypothetical protein
LTSGGHSPISAVSAPRGDGRPLRLDQRACVERLRAGEDVEAAPVGALPDQVRDQFGRARRIEPERLRSAAHAHARALDLEVGVHPNREPRPNAELARNRERPIRLASGLAVDRDARFDRRPKLGVRLPGPAKEIRSGAIPAASASCPSPPEATSKPSTLAAMCLRRGA